ncbi:Component of a membrane-bound complex containing the Tor2p kinase [Coemansia sp. RSA 1290]|nr:Component of a membrane-bound complex containing the Tor2p kinase [Coemansia sp. RSA 1290]KAJ2647629.1 Component of a membrane-bound complex containing the Tor2p kinase [Coemansia sp. RSA 1250]
MSLLTDPAFLVYQLRVSFLRTNDPTGQRVLTFDDLSVPLGEFSQRQRQGSTPPPLATQSRRKTSASEIRQQVAHNTAANPYIMACGHYPETEMVHSADIVSDEGYMWSRAGPGSAFLSAGATRSADSAEPAAPSARPGASGRTKRTNRSAKIAPTGEGREEVVGLGVVPPHPEMMLSAYGGADSKALPALAEAADAGSLSDSAQTSETPRKHWQPEPMPPRRSLDAIAQAERPQGTAQAARRGDRRYAGHTHSNSIATIRLQPRPSEKLRKNSSRDAVALGIDFDVTSMFEAEQAAEPAKDGALGNKARGEKPAGMRSKQRHNTPALHSRKKSTASIELRARRADALRIPLAHLRDERPAGSTLLKRSATLPTKRAGAGGFGGGPSAAAAAAAAVAASQKSRWVGGYAENTQGPRDTGWDHSSSSEDDDAVTPASRRGAGTHTWYGPRAGIRPISMFPPPRANNAPLPLPPVPLMFGADDSDDDIDLEGDESSSRTPAALGLTRGLRTYAGSPLPSIRVQRFLPASSALAASLPAASPPPTTAAPDNVAALGSLSLEPDSMRPRGVSDPEGRQQSRSSRGQLSSAGSASSRPGSKGGTTLLSPRQTPLTQESTASIWQTDGKLRPASGSEPPVTAAARSRATYVPPPPCGTSGLSALLATQLVVKQNPFAEEFASMGANSGNEGGMAEICVFVQLESQKSPSFTVNVRKTASVEQAIGFILYQYLEDEHKPPLEADVQDVVMWSLRIAMDGEVDDDFPAVDRTRPVSNFTFDEFALCLASPDQIKTNESLRVRQGRPPRMPRPKSLLQPTPAAPASEASNTGTASKPPRELLNTITRRVETSAMVLQSSRIATAAMAGIFVGNSVLQNLDTQAAHKSLSPAASSEQLSSQQQQLLSRTAPQQTRLLKVCVLGESSSADALRATTIEAEINATIRMVLAQVCRKKQFMEDQYVLGIFDSSGFVVCNSDMLVLQIPSGAEMYLHRVGAALPTLEQLPKLSDTPLYGQQEQEQKTFGMADDRADALMAAESKAMGMASAYYTFKVVRRAQMFTRHERSLVIDGETITLLPVDHRAETAKTLTFHISNVICKRNQKSPRKIRLFITRRGNTGEKTIDLEALSEDDAASICGILMRLSELYNQTGGM